MRRPRLLRRGALGTVQKAGLIGVQIIVAIARGPMLGGQIDTQLSMVRLGGGGGELRGSWVCLSKCLAALSSWNGQI